MSGLDCYRLQSASGVYCIYKYLSNVMLPSPDYDCMVLTFADQQCTTTSVHNYGQSTNSSRATLITRSITVYPHTCVHIGQPRHFDLKQLSEMTATLIIMYT